MMKKRKRKQRKQREEKVIQAQKLVQRKLKRKVEHSGTGTRHEGTTTSKTTKKDDRSHESMANPFNVAKAKLKEVTKK